MNRKYQLSYLLAAALVFTAAGCGNKSSNSESDNSSSSAPAAPAGQAVDPSTVGEVTGTVTLTGTPPKMKPINMSQEAACASQHSTPAMSEEVVTGDKGALANVIVYVTSGADAYSFPTPADAVEIDQKGCQYHPHILALQAGQSLSVVNDDPTTHNIHPVPKDNREWNESQPPGSAPITQSFARPEVPIPVKCNVHPWMKAYIGVFANPFFSVTGKDGAFDLKGLPPGTYTIVAWQELYGASAPQTVTIAPKQTATFNFTFSATAAGD